MGSSIDWLLSHDTDHYVRPIPSSAKKEYLDQASRALQEAHVLDGIDGDRIERILWEISGALGSCMTSVPALAEAQILAVDAIPLLFRWLARRGPHPPDGSVFMFWDGVIWRKRRHTAEVRDAVFASLACQLFLDDDTVAASAVHGFNHLKDKRCLPLLERIIRTTGNAALAEYARAATGFDLI